MTSRSLLTSCKRPVIKIGSAVLAGAAGPSIDRAKFARLCDDLAAIASGRRPVIVSSGAIALGVGRLQLAQRPKEMALKQAAAAAGQSRLMRLYDDELESRGLHCAQVLLTHADLANAERWLNARHALSELLAREVVPVINENDTVAVEEIQFGDNDALAAMVVDLVDADLLVILTDAGGVFTADPRSDPAAKRLPVIERVTAQVEAMAGTASAIGTGGMVSKLRAARRASEAGVACAIIPGEPGVLPRLLAGEDVGTLVLPQPGRTRAPQLAASERKLTALELTRRARQASRELPRKDRAALVREAAARIEARAADIEFANQADLKLAREAGHPAAFLDRLELDRPRIAAMAKAMRQVAGLPDPVGEIVESYRRPNGLRVERVRAPLGVVLMIYESRPNVTAEAASLCLRSGNAALLRGGSEALQTNSALADCFPEDAVQLVPPDRALLDELLQLEDGIDLCIPRGGPSLIRFISERARVPVVKHYQGVCHLYVGADADLSMAERIALNAKVERPGVCNALECLLVDAEVAREALAKLGPSLRERGVELRCDERALPMTPGGIPAAPEDFGREFLDLKLAVAVVDGLSGALEHIARYGSRHTEAIVTRSAELAERFLREVDASCVLWNASTRFNDGGELGLGAEIGISTSKLHAYGPMGLRELTCTRFVVRGQGQART